MSEIKGQERNIGKVFGGDYIFKIPDYQRPYAWTTEQAENLFDDLYNSYVNKESSYFLGSIVLVKGSDTNPMTEVIDGQQRLTTLTILLSVLRLHTDNTKMRSELSDYIMQAGKEIEGIDPQQRVSLRQDDDEFYRKNILEEDGVRALLSSDNRETWRNLESQRRLYENAYKINKLIENTILDKEQIKHFITHIITKCFFVVVSSPSPESAYRVFSTLNNRGLDLSYTDILKADIIGKIDAQKRGNYAEKWNAAENKLGRDSFLDLFGHIRMIYQRRRAEKSLLAELRVSVIPQGRGSSENERFIDEKLLPYADAYEIITKSAYEATEGAEEVNALLRLLNKISITDWRAVALEYYRKNASAKDASKRLIHFFKMLERYVVYAWICNISERKRIERYKHIYQELDEGSNGICRSSLELTATEKQEFIARLEGDVYLLSNPKSRYLMLRLCDFISDHAMRYENEITTIEHVLPQTIPANSEWEKWWPEEKDRNQWLHKVANLVLLTRRHNSSAQNYSFSDKKEKYFKSKHGVTSYALTTDVINYTEWTAEIVSKRQERLIKKFKEGWML